MTAVNLYNIPTYHSISCLHNASMSRTLSSTVQCFVARSAYWITMNPLTTRRKALKVTLWPLPLSRNREKVSPLYATRCEESSEFQEDLSPSYSGSMEHVANISECCIAEFTCDHRWTSYTSTISRDANDKYYIVLIYCYMYYCFMNSVDIVHLILYYCYIYYVFHYLCIYYVFHEY